MNIFKSKVDSNEYHFKTLKNNMKVLLVSNSEFVKSSCALSVQVGSYDEPVEYLGLAHFLEHMLFMGTEKYPGENHYSEFLSQNGGYSNAYTASENTVYYFDVESSVIAEAIDLFAQFFICPLLREGSVMREVSAVNSEYENSFTNKSWREYMLLCNLCRSDRPESRFNCGNTETLNKPGVLEKLKSFWNEYYSSDIMSLVFCSNRSIREMEKMLEVFEFIENKNRRTFIERSSMETPYTIFDPSYMGKVVQYAPLDDKKTLILSYRIPHILSKYKTNALAYVDFLFTSEESTGLISKLKKEKLGFDVSFDYEVYLEYFSVMIKVDLSEQGAQNYSLVLDIVSTYLANLRADEVEYERLRKINKLAFDFSDNKSPIDLASELAPKLHYYPPENVLNSEYIFEEYDRDHIDKVISYLRDIKTSLIVLADKDGVFNKIEPYYQVHFATLDDVNPRSDLFKIEKTVVKDEFLTNVDLISHEPARQYKKQSFDHGEVHYIFDCKFSVPKTELLITLSGDDIKNNYTGHLVFWNMAHNFYSEQHSRKLTNFDLDICLLNSPNSLGIKFSGFSDRIVDTAIDFFNSLPSLPFDNLDMIKKEIKDDFSSKIIDSPYKRVTPSMRDSYFEASSVEELLNDLLVLNTEKVLRPVSYYTKILCCGNIEYHEIQRLFDSIKASQNSKVTLSPSVPAKITFETKDPINNAVGVFFNILDQAKIDQLDFYHEIDEDQLEDNAKDSFIFDLAVGNLIELIGSEKFFNQLRTIEEFGYIVSSSICSLGSSYYIRYLVQSERSNDVILARILKFVEDLKVDIRNIGEDTLEEFKESLVCLYLDPIVNLGDLAVSCYNQTHFGMVDLNLNAKLAKAVHSITKEDLIASGALKNHSIVHSIRK